MRIIIEIRGRVLDVELRGPRPPGGPHVPSAPERDAAERDSASTTGAQVEQADDGVHGPFGFAPVIRAGEKGRKGPS